MHGNRRALAQALHLVSTHPQTLSTKPILHRSRKTTSGLQVRFLSAIPNAIAPRKILNRITKRKVEQGLNQDLSPSSFVAPCLILAGANAYRLWNEHWEHAAHAPPMEERVEYDYQNIRTKNYFWGDGDKVRC